MWNVTWGSGSNNRRFFLLSFCVVYAVHGLFYTLTEQMFFAALSLSCRGYEAGLFLAYWVISSCGLNFLQMFSDRIWSQCSSPLNDFHLPLFKPYALLLRLNNLSFFNWFSLKCLDPKSYMRVVFFLAMNIMIFWFVLTLELSARLQNTQQCICIDWKTLEIQSANLQANSGLEGILWRHFLVHRRL